MSALDPDFHQELDTDAIAARTKRLNPGNAEVVQDVDLLVGELRYVRDEFAKLQRNIADIIGNLEGAVDRLGRLQRGTQPDHDHRPSPGHG